MPFRSLRTRLLVTSGALIVLVTVATLAYVSRLGNQAVDARMADDLERSRRAVLGAEVERFARLELLAQMVASFPELRGLLATDSATVRDFLSDYRQRHGHQGLLLAIDPRGQVMARSDTFAPLDLPNLERDWLAPLSEGRPVRGFITVEGVVHHAVAAAAESGGTIFGVILATLPIDDAWAAGLRDASGADVVVLTAGGIAGSSLPRSRIAWQRRDQAPATLDTAATTLEMTGERFQAIGAPSAHPGPHQTVVLQSRDQALAPYRSVQYGVIALGLVAIALGLAGSAWLAQSITAPVGQLVRATRQVSAGDFDVRLDVPRTDELGQLARAFNQMTAGLRERADMTRFVSASTMEMIQRRPDEATRAGERRTMTVLFADIRGFTAYSEHRPPEDAVAMLNRYLSLQADLVKRFHGDIDKFMGDAVFAHFTGDDMALDAIRCGLEVQRAIAQASDGAGLAVGVGIATGEVLVGSIGSRDRLDYTAIGPAVNLASRLCAAAEPGQILLDDETFRRVHGLVAATPLAPMAVKGFSAPVTVHSMTP